MENRTGRKTRSGEGIHGLLERLGGFRNDGMIEESRDEKQSERRGGHIEETRKGGVEAMSTDWVCSATYPQGQ